MEGIKRGKLDPLHRSPKHPKLAPLTTNKKGTLVTTWHASIGYTITPRLTEDTAFDVLDALGAYGASQSVSRDFTEAHATMTVTAPTAIDAIECATDAIRAATAPFGTIDITELSPLQLSTLNSQNRSSRRLSDSLRSLTALE